MDELQYIIQQAIIEDFAVKVLSARFIDTKDKTVIIDGEVYELTPERALIIQECLKTKEMNVKINTTRRKPNNETGKDPLNIKDGENM